MYIYHCREWAIRTLLRHYVIAFSLLFLLYAPWFRSIKFLLSIFAGVGVLILADGYSLSITLTTSKLRVMSGFFFCRRTIRYDEIITLAYGAYDKDKEKILYDEIVHMDLSPGENIALPNPTPKRQRSEVFAAGAKECFYILSMDLKDGGYCLIRSKHSLETVFNLIKNINLWRLQ